jgi:hypothetical protein
MREWELGEGEWREGELGEGEWRRANNLGVGLFWNLKRNVVARRVPL